MSSDDNTVCPVTFPCPDHEGSAERFEEILLVKSLLLDFNIGTVFFNTP